jgi:hypothetical protein
MNMSRENILINMQDFISVDQYRLEKSKKEKLDKILKVISTIFLIVLSIVGIIFAKDISTRVYKEFGTIGSGMEHAMQKGYVEYPQMEFNTSNSAIINAKTGESIKDVETSIKVDELLIDDFNVSITFNVNLSDEALKIVKAEDIWNMNFTDMAIVDENGYIFYSANPLSNAENNDKYIKSNLNTVLTEKEGNTLKVVYNLYTKADKDTFPKSKELNIKFSKINISKDSQADTLSGEGEITLSGDWEIKVDISEKMYNRNKITYIQKSTTNDDFNVTKAVLYDTGMEIEVEVDGVDEDKNYTDMWDRIFDIEVSLENENEEIFEEIIGPVENGAKDIDDEGTLTYDAMYELTKYDENDEITVKVTKNEKEASIVLVKEEI